MQEKVLEIRIFHKKWYLFTNKKEDVKNEYMLQQKHIPLISRQ